MLPAVQLATTELVLAAHRSSASAVFLGQSDPDPQPGQNGTGAEFGKSGPIGLVVVLILLVALILLIRSMNRHVRKMPASFDEPVPRKRSTSRPLGLRREKDTPDSDG